MNKSKRFSPSVDLSGARILLTNDDGISSPGIQCLENLIRPIVKELIIVAPENEQSATSHAISIRRPLRVKEVSKSRFSINGTPADSVLIGVTEIMKDTPPDILLSGINYGGNLGEDITYSGTVGAAIEGTLLGLPSIAFSQVYSNGQPAKWSTAEKWLPTVLKKILSIGWPKNVLININFPDVVASNVTGIKLCRQGYRELGHELKRSKDPRNQEYFWIGAQIKAASPEKGTDLYALTQGAISVTPISVDMTNDPTLQTMKRSFNEN